MKIASIAISNVRSFKYDPTFKNVISFDTTGLNLLIGPNASGKSNLVEIVMRIFSNVYDVTGSSTGGNYDSDVSSLIRVTPSPAQLPLRANIPGSLTKHRNSADKDMAIRLKIILDKKDIDNLRFIKEKSTMLKALYEYYFKEAPGFGSTRIFDTSYSTPRVGTSFEITLNEHREQYASFFMEEDPESLAVKYLRDYGLICTLIDMHNELLYPALFSRAEKSNPLHLSYRARVDAFGINTKSRPLKRLNPPLILMSVQERLSDIDLSYAVYGNANEGGNYGRIYRSRQIEKNMGQKSTQGMFSGSQSESFESIKAMLWRDIAKELEGGRNSIDTIKDVNRHNPLLKQFNDFLGHFRLKLQLSSISVEQGKIEFSIDESGVDVNMLDISSGQRAIINIASSLIVGNELKALVLIDEIENHLHPTVQSRLRDALVDNAQDGSQSIAVTHSPIFVTVHTLKSTIRLYMTNGHTVAKKCSIALTRRNKAIFEILDYTNGARVFFSERVLLVEGVSDQELFTAYLRNKVKNTDVEVLRVGGDGELKKWRQIIEDFGVTVSIIADLDTLISKSRKSEIKTKRVGKSKKDSVVWEELDRTEQKDALTKIKTMRRDRKYVLQRGALESYVPGKSDKTDRVREFIAQGDWSKLNYKKELKEIFTAIINS